MVPGLRLEALGLVALDDDVPKPENEPNLCGALELELLVDAPPKPENEPNF